MEQSTLLWCLALSCIAILCGVIYATAWISDDSFITLRVVDNLSHGFGLRWNVIDRVQVSTHPLWLLLLSATVPYLPIALPIGTILVSLLIQCATILCVLWLLCRTPLERILLCTVMVCSRAFVDFSTSGLETPLVLALLTTLIVTLRNVSDSPGRDTRIVALIALLGCTRLDLLVLCAPLAVLTLRNLRWRSLPIWAAASAPLWLWLLFSTIYFGDPFPNTAYAKLSTGIPKSLLLQQGTFYLIDSLLRDPVTLSTIFFCTLAGLRSGSPGAKVLILGVIAQLLYTIWVGGDFMSGRFLVPPFFVAAVIGLPPLAHLLERCGARTSAVLCVGCAALGCTLHPVSEEALLAARREGTMFHRIAPEALRPARSRKGTAFRGIEDERLYYWQKSSLRQLLANGGIPESRFVRDGLRVRDEGGPKFIKKTAVGMFGFYAGPTIHVVDVFALGDPFLSRLPSINPRRWRIGHFTRAVTPEYMESLKSGTNQLTDPKLRELLDERWLITRGPIWSYPRLKLVLKRLLVRPAVSTTDSTGAPAL
ncbi:MAG: hypothetical protein EBZ48_00350 [Proteobacteria bacterium]|nr:hypothetical protein [Pseudomonadota bacterium]